MAEVWRAGAIGGAAKYINYLLTDGADAAAGGVAGIMLLVWILGTVYAIFVSSSRSQSILFRRTRKTVTTRFCA
jgi:hypothetical protein